MEAVLGIVGIFFVLMLVLSVRSPKIENRKSSSFIDDVNKSFDELRTQLTGTETDTDFNPFITNAGEVDFKRMRDEQALVCFDSQYHVYKSTGNYAYAGPTIRLKIVKGLYFRAGGGKVVSSKAWMPEEAGKLVFTNKRVLFIGDRSTKQLRNTKVDIESLSQDVIEIRRDSGPNWMFTVEDNVAEKGALVMLAISQS